MSLGVFDQDVNDKNSLSYPKLYTPGHQDLLFNKKEFLKSAMHGFFTSCILFLVPYGKKKILNVLTELFNFSWLNIFVTRFVISGTYIDGVSPKGHALSDHMLFGSVVATILIIVVTAQVCCIPRYDNLTKIVILNLITDCVRHRVLDMVESFHNLGLLVDIFHIHFHLQLPIWRSVHRIIN